jgi:hypothetical protein
MIRFTTHFKDRIKKRWRGREFRKLKGADIIEAFKKSTRIYTTKKGDNLKVVDLAGHSVGIGYIEENGDFILKTALSVSQLAFTVISMELSNE